MNETILKLASQIEALNEKQKAALAASEAEGVADEKRAEHLAEFDRLQAEKVKAQASLARARQLDTDIRSMEQSTRSVVITDRTNPLPPNPATADADRLPAEARRHGPLKAFRGDDAERRAYRAGMWAAAALFRSEGAAAQCQRMGLPLNSSQGGSLLAGVAGQGAQATLLTNNDRGAGFLVPDELELAIIEIYQEYGVFRRNADVERMTTETKMVPRWVGAMLSYWVGQGQAPTQSDPAWDLVTLVAKNLAAMTKMSRILEEDSPVDLAEKVALAAGIAFALAEDDAGWNGDGSSTYGGITGVSKKILQTTPIDNTPCVIRAGGGSTSGKLVFSDLTKADFQNVVGAYPEYKGSDPKWFISKQGWMASMVALQTAVIGTRPSDLRGEIPKEFLGYPVEITQVLTQALTGTAGKFGCFFGDLKLAAKLGDRRRMSMESGYINDDFTRQLVTILGTSRVDINVHTIRDPKADSHATGGPIIGLQFADS